MLAHALALVVATQVPPSTPSTISVGEIRGSHKITGDVRAAITTAAVDAFSRCIVSGPVAVTVILPASGGRPIAVGIDDIVGVKPSPTDAARGCLTSALDKSSFALSAPAAFYVVALVGAGPAILDAKKAESAQVLAGALYSEVLPVVDVDRFTGVRSVRTLVPLTFPRTDRTEMWLWSTNTKDDPHYATSLHATFYGRSWQYIDCKQVAMLVDGESYPITAKYDNTLIAAENVVEHFKFSIDPVRLANARKVEIRFCGDEDAIFPDGGRTARKIRAHARYINAPGAF